MTPQALYRLEKRRAERRKAKLFAEIRKAHEMLVCPKRRSKPRTDAERAHRRELQRAYRAGRRLSPLDVRA